MMLHNRISPKTEVHLIVQGREGMLKPLFDSKTQEEKENEEISSEPRGHGVSTRKTPPNTHTHTVFSTKPFP